MMKTLSRTVVLLLLFFWPYVQGFPVLDQPLNELIAELGNMDSWVCDHRALLYTPTKVEGECVMKALDCFSSELKTLTRYCSGDLSSTIYNVPALVNELTPNETTESTSCVCEAYDQKPFETYRKEFLSLVQSIASDNSSTSPQS